MRHIYLLKIINEDQTASENISRLLGRKPTKGDNLVWELEIEQREDKKPLDFTNYFLDLLEGKYEALEELGIGRSDISIWLYYQYDQQCNIEIPPAQLKRLGDNGVALCFSCWEKKD